MHRSGETEPLLENAILAAVSLAGLVTFFFPFGISALGGRTAEISSRAIDASLLLAFIVGGCLVVAVAELTRGSARASASRSIALLGSLVAIDASFRLVPSFLGASPIFALIVLVGFVFGSRFGFIMGALTLLLSAAVTAGAGPWLPFQMLCAGWIGLAAGWLPHPDSPRSLLFVLTAFGAITGFAYGLLMNLYAWPFAAPGAAADIGLYWSPALSFAESVQRYGTFYVATSLVHDASRAAATALLLLLAGAPVMRLLQRFRVRTFWETSSSCAIQKIPPA